MTINDIATILSRFVGLQYVVLALTYLSYLPERISAANNARSHAYGAYVNLEIRMLWIRFGINVLAGAVFYILARQIANTVTTGLNADELRS